MVIEIEHDQFRAISTVIILNKVVIIVRKKTVKASIVALFISSATLASLQVNAETYTLFANGYSDNYTPSVPVVDFFGSWKGAKEYNEGSKAIANNFFQIGVQYEALSFAIFYRYDYYLTMHPDVAEYRYTFHNDRDNLQDRDYIYDFKEQRLTTQGIRVGYNYQYNNKLTVTSYLNVLYSSKFQERDIQNGYINGKTSLGDADADYHFSEDTLYGFLTVDDVPQGYGASLDFDVSYQINNITRVDLNVKDAFHFVTWEESPYAQGNFQVDDFYYDSQDVLQQNPLTNLYTHEGSEQHSFTQHLPVRIDLSVEQIIAKFDLSVKYQYNEVMDSVSIKGGYSPFAESNVAISYNFQRSALGLHSKYRTFYLDIMFDDVDFGYANSLSLFLGFEVSI
jgi:hypothetical protein